jgi:hypothetical protein
VNRPSLLSHVGLALLVGAGPLLFAGCKDTPPKNLLDEVRQAMAVREAKLKSYRFHATSKQDPSSAPLEHDFAYREPGLARGVITKGPPLELSFDGKALFKRVEDKLYRYELKLPKEKQALFLHSNFSPFVFEGFRTPLLPLKGVTAAQKKDSVELSVDAGEGVTVVYALKWPVPDFLEKRTSANGQTSVIHVESEHCDKALGLCVPQVIKEGEAVTTLDRIELNPDIPADGFTPQGEPEVHQVIEQ